MHRSALVAQATISVALNGSNPVSVGGIDVYTGFPTPAAGEIFSAMTIFMRELV